MGIAKVLVGVVAGALWLALLPDGEIDRVGAVDPRRQQPALPAIADLKLSTLTTTGGLPITGVITLTSPPPLAGILVQLRSYYPGVLTVPEAIRVAGSRSTVTFTIQTKSQSSGEWGPWPNAVIEAEYAGVKKTAGTGLRLLRPQLVSFSCNPSKVKSGTRTNCTAAVDVPDQLNHVSVQFAPPGLVVPGGSIVIHPGQLTGSYAFLTRECCISGSQTVQLSARLHGVTKTFDVTLTSP